MLSIQKSLRATVLAILGLGGFASATATAANITLFGNSGNITHVQDLYESMGGNMSLETNIFGAGAHISGMILSTNHSLMSIFDDVFTNGTRFYDTDNNTSVSEVRRRAAVKCRSVTCANPPAHQIRLLTDEQQIYLSTKFCDGFVASVPSGTALAGLVVSEMACGSTLQYVCKGIFTVGATIAGTYLGPGIKKQCDDIFLFMEEECGDKGAQAEITITSTGSEFHTYGFATSSSITCSDIGGDCETYTCDGNCNPGNELPS